MELDFQVKNISSGIYPQGNLGQVFLWLSYAICKMGNNNKATSYGYVDAKLVNIYKVLRIVLGIIHTT